MVLSLKRKTLIERIDTQLDAERQTVLRGDLTSLEPLIERREKLVENLIGTIDKDDKEAIQAIENLQLKARRNAGLIRSAIEGITSANQRVAEIEAAHAKLSTYSAQGEISNVVRPKNTITKKA